MVRGYSLSLPRGSETIDLKPYENQTHMFQFQSFIEKYVRHRQTIKEIFLGQFCPSEKGTNYEINPM